MRDFPNDAGQTFATVGPAWKISDIKTTLTGLLSYNTYQTLQIQVSFTENIEAAYANELSYAATDDRIEIVVALDTHPPKVIPNRDCTMQGIHPSYAGSIDGLAGDYLSLPNGTPAIIIGQILQDYEPFDPTASGNTLSVYVDLLHLDLPLSASPPRIGFSIYVDNSKSFTDCAPRGISEYTTS